MSKTQADFFWQSHRRVADADQLFLFFVGDGLTRQELQTNIKRRPEVWGRLRHWLYRLPEKNDELSFHPSHRVALEGFEKI